MMWGVATKRNKFSDNIKGDEKARICEGKTG
jgi:hypothetical protein